MKKIIYLLLSCMLAQSFVACDTVDFGDTNDNVNGPTEPYPAGLMTGAMMSYATTTGRANFLNPTLLVQWQVQVTYTDEMLYAEAPYSWYTYYSRILPGLNQIIAYNSDPSNHTPALLAQGAPENQIGVAMIMKAIVMKRVTDTYGDVPYTEAFKGLENITPAYDKQRDIYQRLIAELKEGRDMLDATKNRPIGDIIYDGNVNRWKKLANSVILQATLQLSETDLVEFAKTEFNAALAHEAGVIETVADEAWFSYDMVAAYNNPFNPNRRADYFLAKEFTDALKGNADLNPTSNRTPDARINVYANSPTLDGVPYGYATGSGAGKNQVSPAYYWKANAPLPMMTASYTYLNRAEAAARGWTTEVATEMLRKGIEMSFTTLEIHAKATATTQAQIDRVDQVSEAGPAYAAARLVDAATVGLLKVIAEEKWKSLFPQGFDAWAEWRRTGLPTLIPARDAVNSTRQIPTRYLYPVEESTVNPTNYAAGVGTLSPASDNNTGKVWWDQ